MTVTVQLEDGTIVTGTKVTATRTAVKNQTFRVLESCPLSFKGKQRMLVVTALRSDPESFFSPEQVAELVGEGFPSKFEAVQSIRYHLHQLDLLGHVEVK